MGRKKEFNEGQINDIINLYCDKLESIVKIAEKYSCDASVIKRILKSNNINVSSGSAYNINFWVNRGMSEDEAKYHISTLRPSNVNFWLKKGLSYEEAILATDMGRCLSLEGAIYYYGEELGVIKYAKTMERNIANGKKSPRVTSYWVSKGYSEEEAKIKVSETQSTFSLKKCIKKHGEEQGKKIWMDRQIKWINSTNKNGNLKRGFSKISQELFIDIIKKGKISKNEVYFSLNNKEYSLVDETNNKIYKYDFTHLKNRKIIEFHGDIFHANPNLFTEESTPNPFKKKLKAKDIWDYDEKRINFATQRGFEVLVIWENDYKINKEEAINKCIKFINNNYD
jgi:hypothetical protein